MGTGSFAAPVERERERESTVDVERRVMKKVNRALTLAFNGGGSLLCLAPPCSMPQPQRGLYMGVTLNLAVGVRWQSTNCLVISTSHYQQLKPWMLQLMQNLTNCRTPVYKGSLTVYQGGFIVLSC